PGLSSIALAMGSGAHFARLLEAKARLLGQRDDAAAIILSAPYDGDIESAAVVMQEFIGDLE
ncbi:exosortase-associated EpsI family protein, partial [Escherichia coli]|uniref:exosortase-associated EpsI family protein n=1 Tax=Escherichia coli TaxID=562 RepID=UPI0013D278B8